MPKPWEKYQGASGPWQKYQTQDELASYQPSLLEQAADFSQSVQESAFAPLAAPTEKVGRFASNVMFRSEKPYEAVQAGLGAVTGGLEKLGQVITEKGVQAGLPVPAAATAGFLASEAPYFIPMGKAAEFSTKLKNFSGKPGVAARLKQMRTGVEASAFEQLRRDPGAFFIGKSREKLGADVGEAKSLAGINTGVSGDIKTLTKENLGRARSTIGTGNKAQDVIAEKIQQAVESNPSADVQTIIKNSGITPTETNDALVGVNERLKRIERSAGRGSPSFQQWSAIKNHLQSVLDEVAPGVREANKAFSRVALRDRFMEPLPVNQSGTMSKISGFGFGAAATGTGAIVGGGPGAVAAYAAYQGVRSPFVAGLGTAMRGYIDKILDPAFSFGGRALSNRPLMAEYIDRLTTKRGSQ